MDGKFVNDSAVAITPSNDFAAYDVRASYKTYYLVTVASPIPVTVSTHNESATASTFSEWVPSGSAVSVYVPKVYAFDNSTRLVYKGSNLTVVADRPLTLAVDEFERQYYVAIDSEYPVSINGVKTAHYSEWAAQGSALTIAPATVFANGVFLSEPGYNITVDRPIKMTVEWTVNWALTASLYSAIVILIAAAAFAAKSSKKRRAYIEIPVGGPRGSSTRLALDDGVRFSALAPS